MTVVKKYFLRQYLIVIVANFNYVLFGLETGWPSPVIVKLKEANQTVLPFPISDNDAAWVASIGILLGTIFMLVSGYIIDRFGRKLSMVLLNIPRLAKCFLLIFASEVWMLLLGRAINGLSDVFSICAVFTYTSEIASKEIRGALGTISQMSFAIGMMVMLTVGPFQSYLWLNIMTTILVFVLSAPLLFLPETPYYLYAKGRKEECMEALISLRGSKEAANEEIIEYSSIPNVSIDKRKLLQDTTFWKSLGRGLFLVLGSQFTGYNSLSYYLQTVFASTNTTVKPEISSLVIGFVELLGCFCTIILTDRLGRKPLLIVCLTFIAFGMCGLGTFFYLKNREYEIVGFLNYLPLLSVMLTIFCYNAGVGSIMMMYSAELFEGPSRAFGISIIVFMSGFVTFVFVRYFAAVTNAVGAMSTYYGFAVSCIIVCVVVAFFLPETKGKSFSQIQNELKSEKTDDGHVTHI